MDSKRFMFAYTLLILKAHGGYIIANTIKIPNKIKNGTIITAVIIRKVINIVPNPCQAEKRCASPTACEATTNLQMRSGSETANCSSSNIICRDGSGTPAVR